MKKFFLPLFVLIMTLATYGQDTHKTEFWGGYITRTKLNNNWSLWNDTHFATESFFILRHGLNYHIDKNAIITGGYAWLYTATSQTNDLVRFEHRPWAQFDIRVPLGKHLRFSHRVRYDFRIRKKLSGDEILDDFTAYHRLRFMNGIQIPLMTLDNGKKIDFNIIDEILFNLGSEKPKGNYFDQNRIWLLVGFSPVKDMRAMVGYVNRMAPAATPNDYNHRHGIAIWIIHSFDLSKKDETIIP